MGERLGTVLALAGLLALGTVAPARAGDVRAWNALATAVEDVSGATELRYAARDDRGATLDGLKVIQVGRGRYVGVYHSPGGTSFDLHVATSSDLMGWTRRATLDGDASQATIAAVPGDGFVVVYEKAFTADVLPLTKLPSELDVVNGLTGRIRLRFRHYASVERLLAGAHSREFTAPRTVALTAEGTPDIQRIVWNGALGKSRIELGLHHFADTDGDLFPDADRQGTGVLTGFRRWRDATAPEIDAAFLGTEHRHGDFQDRPPSGNIGDRDTIVLFGARLALHEAQYDAGDFGTWRLFLRDVATNALRPLSPRTHAGSRAFGNPTVTALAAPDGRPAIFVSMFVFGEGSAPGEVGSLIFYRAG